MSKPSGNALIWGMRNADRWTTFLVGPFSWSCRKWTHWYRKARLKESDVFAKPCQFPPRHQRSLYFPALYIQVRLHYRFWLIDSQQKQYTPGTQSPRHPPCSLSKEGVVKARASRTSVNTFQEVKKKSVYIVLLLKWKISTMAELLPLLINN